MIIRPEKKAVSFAQYSAKEVEVAVGTDVSIITGNPIRLKCMLRSEIGIKVIWLMNGVRLPRNGRKYKIAENFLHIRNTTRGGVYNITCQAKTMIGTAQISSVLKIVGTYKHFLVILVCNHMLCIEEHNMNIIIK